MAKSVSKRRANLEEQRKRMDAHAAGMRLSKGVHPEAYNFHAAGYEEARKEWLAEFDRLQKYTPQSQEVRDRRNRIHRHNGFQGSVAMALSFVRQVQKATTTTDKARVEAIQIEIALERLREMLRTRREGT